MAYADKCFYFDWWDREIKLKDFDNYNSVTIRKRWIENEMRGESEACVSIELWGKLKDNSDERYDDQEIVLSKDDAMVLATKLMRAVAELDADEYLSDMEQDIEILKGLNREKFDKAEDARREYGLYREGKGGLLGAIQNYAKTPRGKDTIKKMEGKDDNPRLDG